MSRHPKRKAKSVITSDAELEPLREPKHPQIQGIDVPVFRDFLKKHAPGRCEWVTLSDAIDFFKCSALEADEILRRAAKSGYLTFSEEKFYGPVWKLTDQSIRLSVDRLLPSIDRAGVDKRIAKVMATARGINVDPNVLHRVSALTLFGSSLDETRTDFGDVDIEVTLVRRQLDEAEKERIAALIAPRVPEYMRQSMFYRSLGPEENQDSREINRKLRGSDQHISLCSDQLKSLDCPRRAIY